MWPYKPNSCRGFKKHKTAICRTHTRIYLHSITTHGQSNQTRDPNKSAGKTDIYGKICTAKISKVYGMY